ncbi:DUF3267 domain-containing protein [Natrononativus amylolyticus]|uniref:DUF3267 domain-containing protein n=1 Tax=Natrononativus amylolyticus TaxID=2963434 RepID=UPI0020CD612C|nr:DUF3267 domain-containing protein [Natrononativus amylolyticus]
MSESAVSRVDTTEPSETPPEPEGYAAPSEFSYPTVVLVVGAGLLGVASTVALVVLLSAVHGPEAFASVYEMTTDGDTMTFAMDLTAIIVPFVVALVVTTVVHEALHGAAFAHYGYDVSYGVIPSMGAFYTAVFGQFQKREELLRVGLAPLVVITAVCVPLLAVPVPVVAITAAFVLILNTSGAIGDLYATWRLARMPPGTLMYDVDIRHSYVYEPLE